MDATLTARAARKNAAAYGNAMHRLNTMTQNGTAKEMVTAQGDIWMRLIIAGAYTPAD